MATNTTNYNFKKPDESDFYSIQDQNGNWDKADLALKDLDTPTFEDYSGSTPVPDAATAIGNIKSKGKLSTALSNIKAAFKGACLIGQIVNNCVSSDTKKPLSAAQGKVLMDLYNVLNTNLDGFQFYATLEALDITGTDFSYQVFVDHMPVNSVLICRVSGLTFTPTNGEFYLRATCTGYPESKRIEFEAIEMSSNLSGVYKARYSAPAGTKWAEWKRAIMNTDLKTTAKANYNDPAGTADAYLQTDTDHAALLGLYNGSTRRRHEKS